MMKTKELDGAYVAHTYNRFPVEIVSGHGSLVTDDAGREYIDMGSGIAVNIFGMNDEGWKAAVKAQLDKCQHTSNLYYTAPCAQLAELLDQVLLTATQQVIGDTRGAVMEVPVVQEVVIQREEMES